MNRLRLVSRLYALLLVLYLLVAFRYRHMNFAIDGQRVSSWLLSGVFILAWFGIGCLGLVSFGPGIPRSSLKKLRFRPETKK
jgi:hypothetical protein